MVGNYLAKLTDQENYDVTLDKFSTLIIAGTLGAIARDDDGVLDKLEMQISDYETWQSLGMEELFPVRYGWASEEKGGRFIFDLENKSVPFFMSPFLFEVESMHK